MSALVVPAPSGVGEFGPDQMGWKSWSMDPAPLPAGTIIPTAGLLHGVRLYLPRRDPVSGAVFYLTAAGATLSNVGVALYSAAGALLTSSVNANGATAAAFQTINIKAVTFSTPQVIEGEYSLCWWFTGTTLPTMLRGASITGVQALGKASPSMRFFTANTGLTTAAPASLTAQTQSSSAFFAATT